MALYYPVDPTDVEVNPSHVVCYGQCPVCEVFWSARPDNSCDCFSPDSQADQHQQWQMFVRQQVSEVIKLLGP